MNTQPEKRMSPLLLSSIGVLYLVNRAGIKHDFVDDFRNAIAAEYAKWEIEKNAASVATALVATAPNPVYAPLPPQAVATVAPAVSSQGESDAVMTLVALGYRRGEAQAAIATTNPSQSPQERVAAVLRARSRH